MKEDAAAFVLMCQHKDGGIMKFPDGDQPDPIHTCHSLLGMAFLGMFELDLEGYSVELSCFQN